MGERRFLGNRKVGDTDECSQKDGSRNSDGYVPGVNWNDSKVQVNWYNLDNSNSDYGLRSEVLALPRSTGFCVMYLIQPFVIFEVSIKSASVLIYCFSVIIFSSCSIRIRCFSSSRLIRVCSRGSTFFICGAREALIMSVIVSSAMCSMPA